MFNAPIEGQLISSLETGNTYRIGKVIGEGHFGVVYECQDLWGNNLAVKVLKPLGTYDQVRGNAVAELEKLRKLRHPNITYVYDAFEFRNAFYIVCERCWEPVSKFIQQQDFVGEVWLKAIARGILQAVHFLHCNKYVHQDIHAGNVFVAAVGDDLSSDQIVFHFILGDLGIAKLASDIDGANTVLADWMRAPETLIPTEYGAIDHRMDLYHCGLLFLQVLMGKPLAFTREEVLAGLPRQLALQLATPYSFALEKALRRHVANRTQSALELWRDLSTPASTA